MSPQTSKPLLYEETAKGLVARAFEGAITTRLYPPHEVPKGRDHKFEIVFQLDHPRLLQFQRDGQKPPLHFHTSQHEYVQVLEGRLGIELEGKERVLTPEDGEVCIKPWTHHRLLATSPTDDPSGTGRRSVFTLSSTDTDQMFKLDEIFYENWYSYQEEFVIHGKGVSLLQVLVMFDAGGSYLSLPNWIPFNKQISYYVLGIAMGRYLAAALGYQPYYKEWTQPAKWNEACQKMKTTLFQRKFAKRD